MQELETWGVLSPSHAEQSAANAHTWLILEKQWLYIFYEAY